MSVTKGIYWLSSYPKSGNTWFRIILSYVLSQAKNLNYINDMDNILGCTMAANRSWMNKVLGFDSMLLTHNEIEQLRPGAYKWYAQQVQKPIYNKIHDAYIYLENNNPLIPVEGCLGAIYFIRNPLDVAVSLANYVKCPLDWSIYMMGNEHFVVPIENNNAKQIQQKLLTWSQHVKSWATAANMNLLILRYEDMFYKPLETFAKGMAFLNIDVSSSLLQAAITDSAFTKLQQYEDRFGFKEKPEVEGRFFRKGIVGDWVNTLSTAQVEKIIHDHSDVMRTYGYLDDTNNPIRPL